MIVPENSREFLNQSDSRLKTNRNQVTRFRGLFTLSLWYFYSLWQNNFRLSAASNPRLLWFSFTSLCEWSRKLTPISYTITCHHVTWSSALPVLLTIRLFFLEFSSYSDDVSICFRQSVENFFSFSLVYLAVEIVFVLVSRNSDEMYFTLPLSNPISNSCLLRWSICDMLIQTFKHFIISNTHLI